MSEYCHVHGKDYNILCGCDECKKEAEPILSPGMRLTDSDLESENERLMQKALSKDRQILSLSKDLEDAIDILRSISKRG